MNKDRFSVDCKPPISSIVITFIIIVCILLLTFRPDWSSNFIGNRLGYENCPNCGDSFFGKPQDIFLIDGMDNPNQKGIMICKSCLSNPAQLDELIIYQNIIGDPNQSLQEAELIKQTIIRYKEKHKNLERKE